MDKATFEQRAAEWRYIASYWAEKLDLSIHCGREFDNPNGGYEWEGLAIYDDSCPEVDLNFCRRGNEYEYRCKGNSQTVQDL